jgi:Kef-type K+ transport system membrane component KefB
VAGAFGIAAGVGDLLEASQAASQAAWQGTWKVWLQRINAGPAVAFLILMLALIAGPRLAEKLKLPGMVGLVLAGAVIGPHELHVLDGGRIAISAWGSFGLLYLMFTAGLELDLRLLGRMKRAALTFAVLSFALPFALGFAGATLLGYASAGAILMGSNWGSHTLVTYPILRQMGLARNRAVGTVVGATAVTDTTALLVLTGVAASAGGRGGGLALHIVGIGLGLTVLAFWTLFLLPRLAQWFFARVGGDRSYRFVFGMMAFLSGAVLAEAAAIDGVVGAFFAGLGVNRAIPERSPLMERVQFFGSALFIPIFLVSVGLLLDPRVLIDPRTLLVAGVFTVVVLGGKALAAIIAGRRFRFSGSEVGVMAGLSSSQAAATLATTVVGARLHIFDARTINAVLVVILISLVVTPALVTVFGKRVPRQDAAAEALGSAVLVPVWSGGTPPFGLASSIAACDGGIVMPAGVAGQEATDEEIADQRSLLRRAEDQLSRQGLESRALFRVSSSVHAGLYQTMRGEGATLVITEWSRPDREHINGDAEAFRLLTQSPVPVLLTYGPVDHFQRVVLLVRERDLVRPGSLDLALAAELAARLCAGRRLLCVGTAAARGGSPFAEALAVKPASASSPSRPPSQRHAIEWAEAADPVLWAEPNLARTDLLFFPGVAAANDALERLPRLARGSFLVAVAAHGGLVPALERPAGDLVMGRTATESDAARA